MSLTRWWWLILFLVVLSGAFAPSEAGAVSPDDVWTEGKKKALVWLKIMLDGGEPYYGTGFLVRGRRGQLYVLTATHVVQGNSAPKDYTQGKWKLKQGSELRLGLSGGDLLASDYVINLFNGVKPLEVSAVRLSPRPSLFPLPISFAPIGKDHTLSLAGFPRGEGTPEIRSGEVKALVSPLELVVSANITYNADMVVVNIDTVEGESGGPYLDRNGVAVGLHFGAVMNRGGHAHLIPFDSISNALKELEIEPVLRNGGQPWKENISKPVLLFIASLVVLFIFFRKKQWWLPEISHLIRLVYNNRRHIPTDAMSPDEQRSIDFSNFKLKKEEHTIYLDAVDGESLRIGEVGAQNLEFSLLYADPKTPEFKIEVYAISRIGRFYFPDVAQCIILSEEFGKINAQNSVRRESSSPRRIKVFDIPQTHYPDQIRLVLAFRESMAQIFIELVDGLENRREFIWGEGNTDVL
jgi:hypothetical protein